MLPERLSWRDLRPPYPLDPQDPVTMLLWDPDFYTLEDEDDHDGSEVFWYICLMHDRTYRHGQCTPGPHRLALLCTRHGFEEMWPGQHMRQNPEGFEPPLSDEQIAELEAMSV